MKFINLVVVIVFLGACRPYPCTRSAAFPTPRKYFMIEHSSNSISSVQDLPRRIRHSELLKNSHYTSDTAAFYQSAKSLSLFVIGWYHKKSQCGYFISAERVDTSSTLPYTCTLMEVADGKLNSSSFHIPRNAKNLYDAEPYLTGGQILPFGGRIGTKKELRRQYRKFKRKAKKESR